MLVGLWVSDCLNLDKSFHINFYSIRNGGQWVCNSGHMGC